MITCQSACVDYTYILNKKKKKNKRTRLRTKATSWNVFVSVSLPPFFFERGYGVIFLIDLFARARKAFSSHGW